MIPHHFPHPYKITEWIKRCKNENSGDDDSRTHREREWRGREWGALIRLVASPGVKLFIVRHRIQRRWGGERASVVYKGEGERERVISWRKHLTCALHGPWSGLWGSNTERHVSIQNVTMWWLILDDIPNRHGDKKYMSCHWCYVMIISLIDEHHPTKSLWGS